MATKKTKEKEIKPMSKGSISMDDYDDKFSNDLGSFLSKSMGLSIESLDEHENIPYWIPSGCLSLNWIISNQFFNGIPGSKAVLIAGASESGKSLITDALLGQNIQMGGMSMKVDIEDSAGYDFTSQIVGSKEIASKIKIVSPATNAALAKEVADDDDEESGGKKGKGGKLKKVITVESLTQLINKVLDFQESKKEKKSKSVMMVVDSVTQMTSEKEFADIAANKDKRDMTSAQKIRALFRAVTQRLRGNNTTIIGIAHLTANIGDMFGPKFVVNAKGTGFAYASTLTLLMMKSKEMIDAKTGTPIGLKLRIKTHKNRCALKGRSAWMKFYFAKGIDKYGGLCDLLAQYGVFKPSKQSVSKFDFEYDEKTKFTYVKEDGSAISFKEKDFPAVVEENGGDAFLQELNDKLNAVYQNIMDGDVEDFAMAMEDDTDIAMEGDDGEEAEYEEGDAVENGDDY